LSKSIAPSTEIQYQRKWNQWTDYCHRNELPLYRPEIAQLLDYLALISETSSLNVVYTHLSAINHYHRVELLPSVSDNEHVSAFMRGLKRVELENLPPRVTRAKPMTPEVLLKLANLVQNTPDLSLKTWRTIWRIFVCYYCLLRWDDVKKLKMEDLTYEPENECYRLRLHPGKTGDNNYKVFW